MFVDYIYIYVCLCKYSFKRLFLYTIVHFNLINVYTVFQIYGI